MGLKFTVNTNGLAAIADRLKRATPNAEHALAKQVQKDTAPYTPFLTGSLEKRTRVDGNEIIYPGPYSKYLYYGKYMVTESGAGPMHYIDKNGNEVIQYPKGSRLHATDRDLVFTTVYHPNAQAHWFEASKAQNLEKWERLAAQEEINEFKKQR